MKKRLTAILLTAALCLSLLPVSAFSAEPETLTPETALDEAETLTPETALDEAETLTPETALGEDAALTAQDEPEAALTPETPEETADEAATLAATTTVYVSSSGSDSNAGTETKPYATLSKAFTSLSSGGTVYVLTDLTVSSIVYLSGSKNYTLDGNGTATVTMASSVTSNGMITLYGSDINTNKYTGTLTIQNITLDHTGNNNSTEPLLANWSNGSPNATVNLDNVTLRDDGSAPTLNMAMGTLKMTDVTFDGGTVGLGTAAAITAAGPITATGTVLMQRYAANTVATITRSSDFTDGDLLQVGTSATAGYLTLNGITLQGDGETEMGRAISMVNGTAALQGTTIQNFVYAGALPSSPINSAYLIAMDANKGTCKLTMDSASKIVYNTIKGSGKGLITSGYSQTAVLSGTISNNTLETASQYLLAVGHVSGSRLTLDGATITNNTMPDSGYALLAGLAGSAANVLVKGATQIKDNTTATGEQHNVYLSAGGKLALDSALTSGASIGVTTETKPVEATPVTVAEGEGDYAATGADAECFISDGGDYLVVCENAAVKLSIGDDYYVRSDGDDNTGAGTKDAPYATIQAAYNMIATRGTIHVMDDLKLGVQTTFDSDKTVVVVSDSNGNLDDEETATVLRTAGSFTMLYVSAGNVTLKNIVFDGNSSTITNAHNAMRVMSGATLTLGEGSVIQNNYTGGSNTPGLTTGTGVCVYGTLNIAGGVIRNNFAYSRGAVTVYGDDAVVNMTSGEITGNEIEYKEYYGGGGVYIEKGVFNMSGGIITGNSDIRDKGYGGGVYLVSGGAMNISGSPVITGNTAGENSKRVSNVYLGDDVTMTITGPLAETASIGVATNTIPTTDAPVTVAVGSGYTVTANDAARFSSDVSAYQTHYKEDGDAPSVVLGTLSDYYVSAPLTEGADAVEGQVYGDDETGDGTPDAPFATLAKAYETVYPGGTIHVMSDLTLDSSLSVSKSVTILSDRDGSLDDDERYTITRGTSLTTATMLTVTGTGVEATLKNIVFDGNKENVTSRNALRVENKATLTLDTGAVVQNNKTGNGSGETNDGAVVVSAATLYIKPGAEIKDNESYGRGGGVSTRTDDAVVYMTGGSITGNKNINSGYPHGGGVYLEKGTFNMSGGEITGNSTAFDSGKGGGVYLIDKSNYNPVLNVSGTAIISGNTSGTEGSERADNVYLESGRTIGVTGALDETASIGVTTVNKPSVGNPVTVATNAGKGDAAYFFSDDAAYFTEFDSGNNAVTLAIGNDLYVSSNGSDSNNGAPSSPYATLGAAYSAAASAGLTDVTIHVMTDLTLSSALTVGMDVTILSDDADVATENDKFTIARDGTNFTSGSMLTVSEGSTLTLRDLTLDGSSVSVSGLSDQDGGAGVYVKSGATLNATSCAFQNHFIPAARYGAAISSAGTSVITDCQFTGNYTSSSGSAVFVHGGEMTITGSEFTGNKCNSSQGTLFVHSGEVAVTNTSFTGNTAAYGGAAVFQDGGVLTLGDGVTLSGNSVTGSTDRGAIWVNSADATLTVLDGAAISGNTGCSGVYLANGVLNLNGGSITGNALYGVNVVSGTLNLSGDVTIADNTNGNLYLPSGVTAKLTAALGENASIGVTTATKPTTTANVDVAMGGTDSEGNAYTVTSDDAAHFFSDNATYTTKYDGATSGSEKVVLTLRDDYYVRATGSDTTGVGTPGNPYATLAKAYSSLPSTGGTIHVMSDLTLSSTLTVGKDVTILSDDADDATEDDHFTITRDSGFGTDRMINVTSGSLTLKDLTLDGNNVDLGGYLSEQAGGAGVYVNSGATLTATNCAFQNHVHKFGSRYGAAVFNCGTAKLENCDFKDNQVISVGSAVFNSAGTMTVTGCTFTGNTCTSSEGALYVRAGEVTVTNTSFTGNTAAYGAPALCVDGGTLTLGADVTISGNSITGSKGDHGAVWVKNGGGTDPVLNILDGVIIENNTGCSGVYLENGVLNLNGGSITGNALYGVNVASATPTLNLSGDVTIADNASGNLYLPSGVTANLTAALGDNASIGVTTVDTPTVEKSVTVAVSSSDSYDATAADAARFTSDNEMYTVRFDETNQTVVLSTLGDYYVSADDGNDETGNGTPGNPYATLAKAYEMVYPGGTIHVMTDLTMTATLTVGKDVAILSDSNGVLDDGERYTITRDETNFTSGNMLTVSEDSTLTLRDLTLDGSNVSVSVNGGGVCVNENATLTAANCVFQNHQINSSGGTRYGAAIYNHGTAAFTGCTFQYNSLSTTGPAIYSGIPSDGTATNLTVTDCVVTGNECTSSEGAVSVDNGTATITNTAFTNNKSAYAGPALRVFGGTVTLENVTISGNTITGTADRGAVYVAGNYADVTVNMSNVTITENGIGEDGVAAATACSGIYMSTVSGKTYSVTLNLSDNVTVTGNTGYGVNVVSGALNLSGDVTITDNQSGNLYLPSGVTANLTAALGENASIGVTTATKPATISESVDVAVGSGYTVAATDAAHFFSDDAAYTTEYDGATSGSEKVVLTLREDYYVSAPLAEGESAVDGKVYGSDETGDGTPANPYATISKAYDAVPDGGTIHVMSDLTLDGQLSLDAEKTVTIVADSDGDLTDEESAAITRDESFTSGSMVNITAGNVTLKGVTIKGNGISGAMTAGYGVGVTVTGGTLTIGAGACLTNHIFINNNGEEIEKPYVSGGLYVGSGGTVILDGGSITNNQGDHGGGVLSYGTFVMESGTISGNVASYGGGVYAIGINDPATYSTLTLKGGTITNNYASATTSGGGGVQVDWYTNANIGNVTITQNGTNGQDGAGLLFWSNKYSTVTFTDAPVIEGNYKNATFADNTVTAGDTAVESNLYLRSRTSDDQTTVTPYTVVIADGGLSTGASIGVSTAISPTASRSVDVATNASAADKEKFFSDNGRYTVMFDETNQKVVLALSGDYYVRSNGDDDTGDGTPENPYATIAKAYEAANTAGLTDVTIHVMDDLTVDTRMHPEGTTTKTITVVADSNGDLTDGETAQIIRNFGEKTFGGDNSLFYVKSGYTMTLRGLTLDGKNMSITERGLGVFVGSGGTLTAIDCVFLNHTTGGSKDGSAIYSAGTTTLTNCEFKENTASGKGAVAINGGTLNLSGDVIITGNTNGNLYLYSGYTVAIGSEGLSEGASIGVSTAITPTASSPVDVATNATAADAAHFFSDNIAYSTKFDSADNKVVLGLSEDYYVKSDGNNDTGDGTPSSPYATIAKAYEAADTAGLTEVTIHVMDDLTVATRMHPEGATTKTITVVADSDGDLTDGETAQIIRSFGAGTFDDDNSLFYVANGYTMTLRGLTLDGKNESIKERGLGVFVASGGTLTVTDCVFLNHKTGGSSNGSAIYSEGTTTLTNCEFKENTTGGTGAVAIGGGTLNLSGDVIITGNTGGNLYLNKNVTATLTDALGDNASIGVSTAITPTASSPVNVAVSGTGYDVTAADAAHFFSDVVAYSTKFDSGNNKVVLGLREDYYVSVNGDDETGDGTMDNPYATIQAAYDAAVAKGLTDVTIHVMTDLTLSATVTVSQNVTIVADSDGDLTDGEQVTLTRSDSFTGITNNTTLFQVTGGAAEFKNLTIDGNADVTTASYPAISVTDGATATLSGNTTLKNHTIGGDNGDMSDKGVIYLNNGVLNIQDNVSITGNNNIKTDTTNLVIQTKGTGNTVNMTGGSITGNKMKSAVMQVGSSLALNVSGAAVISGNTDMSGNAANVSLAEDYTITVTGELSDNASIGVTTATAPATDNPVDVAVGSGYTVTAADREKFFSDNTDYETAFVSASSKVVLTTGNKLYVSSSGDDDTGTGTRSNPLKSIYGAFAKCTTSGSAYEVILLSDVNLTQDSYSSEAGDSGFELTSISAGVDITILSDPDGENIYTILRDKRALLYIKAENSHLTLKNVTYTMSASSPDVVEYGAMQTAAICVRGNNSSITLDEGATLDGFQSIFAAAYMFPKFTGNQIIMKPGSKIVNCANTATDGTSNGGAVYVGSGTFVMEGGEISGNTAGTGCGGVYVDSNGAMTVSGDAKIYGNTCNGSTDNVYLPSGKTLTVAGELTEDASIGVTQAGAAAGTAFATSASGYAVTDPDASAFFDDADTFGVAVSGSNLVWETPAGTAEVKALFSYAQGTSVTALFQVTYSATPSNYTVSVTGGSVGKVTAQGGFHGGNYVVKVDGLTAGTTYTVSAVVDSKVYSGGLSWTAPAATYAAHGESANTSGYWSSTEEPAYRTDADGVVTDEVVSGIAYSVKSDQKIDIQGYGKTRTTYANAGWTPLTSGGTSLQVWASPSVVTGASGADYVVLTYYIRNNSDAEATNVWLGANADVMIGSNDKAPVYKMDYGLRTALSTDEDALSFAIITQHSDEGVAQYASTVSTLWFGYWKDRAANTFKNAAISQLTGTDSGAAFSWKIGSLAAGAVETRSVVIGVAGKEDQERDITGTFETSSDGDGPDTTVTISVETLPLSLTPVTEGIQVTVYAGQTYVLTDADDEIVDTYEATADGTYTFSGLLSTVTYTVTTRKPDVETVDGNGVVTAITQYAEGTATATPLEREKERVGVIVLNDPGKDQATLTYTFPSATAQIQDTDGNEITDGKFYNVSVMVDSGSFTLTSDALAALSGYAAVSGLDVSGNYITSVAGGKTYTYLIFSFTDGVLASKVQEFLRALTFTVEGYGVSQTVEVDADVIELPTGVARLGSSYYRYVAYKGITWSNAYKAAKASAFNGLTGYLMTVDSALEHNFVYQAFGSVNGWMGGLRTTAASGFDTATYATVNPNKSGTWKWVCGPNAGKEFWKGWSSSTSNAVTGVYANWKSGEPNNSTYEYSAQYGFGAAGKWNDYKPNNSAIGGYFIEYTAYGTMTAVSPMAHDAKTTEFGNGVIVSTNGVNGTTGYDSVSQTLEKLNGDYDINTQVLRLTSDITEGTIAVDQTIYLDLNGHSDTIQTLGEGVTLYGMDSATDGYNDAAPGQLVFQGDVTGQVAPITTTTAAQTSTAKRYVAVANYDSDTETTTVEFHRFNVWVTKVSGTYWYNGDDFSASLTYTMGVRGDTAAMGAIKGLGASVEGAIATGTLDDYGIASDAPSNYSTYTTTLISSENAPNDYSTEYSVAAVVSFGEGENRIYTSTPQARSLLWFLKTYYNTNATNDEKTLIETFIEKAGLTEEWEKLST